MAIIVNFNGVSLLQPGSYSDIKVLSGGVAEPAIGTVALIGEAEEGDAFSAESGVSAVSFGPDEFSAIQEKYGSGPLVDAAKIAIAPANDPQLKGGAQEIVLIKTNASTKAQMTLPTAYGTVKAKKAGAPGNSISAQVDIVSQQAIITISALDKGISEISDALGGNAVMSLECTDGGATVATASISATALTTTLTGATSAAALNIPLKGFATVAQLAAFISAQTGYSAVVASAAMGNLPVSVLDHVSAVDILTPYNIKKDAFEVRDFFSKSGLVDFVPTLYKGLPIACTKTFLTGGAKGSTSAGSITSGFDGLLKRRVNFVVPLFSRDATADIADSLTESASNYTIDAVHAGLKAHVNQASTIRGRKERQGWAAYKGSFANAVEKAAALGSARVQMVIQDADILSASSGQVELMQPHMLAVVSACMKASAPIGLSNLNKTPSISGFDHVDFDPETQADQAIAANIAFVSKAPSGSGFRWAIDNSTYPNQDDKAWIFNRPSVMFAADFAAFAIRLNTEVFVGQRNSDVSEETIKNALNSVMDSLKDAGVIVGDTNTGGRGFKDLKVKIAGSIVRVEVTLALVENLEFVLNDIKVQRAG